MTIGLGIIDEYALNIFTDGSSFPSKKRAAGIGVRFVWVKSAVDEETDDHAPIGYESATVDEMEIQACAEGMREAARLVSQPGRLLARVRPYG